MVKVGTQLWITFPSKTEDDKDCYQFYQATVLARKTGRKQKDWWQISWKNGSGKKDFKFIKNKERFKHDELLPYDEKNEDLWCVSESCTVVVKEETKDTANAKRFDLEKELNNIIGLAAVKKQIRSYSSTITAYKARVALGVDVKKPQAPHMAFMGNPGVGKTTVARLMKEVLVDAGMLGLDAPFVEVQKSDVVAGFVGQTMQKTKAVVESALGGVLFVDEAYQLAEGGKEDYGKEALAELMKALLGNDPIMIFAGYAEDMKTFIDMNKGLPRRIPHQFFFEDMTVQELAALAVIKVNKSAFKLSNDITVESIESIIEEETTPTQRAQTNGGLIDLLFKGALVNLDSRLSGDDLRDVDTMMTYEIDDLHCGLNTVPKPVSEWDGSVSNGISSPSTKTLPSPKPPQQAEQSLPAGQKTKQSSVTMQNSVLSPSSPFSPSSGLTASGQKKRVIGEKEAPPLKSDQRQHLEKWFDERLENVEYTLKGSNKKKGRLKFVDLKKDYRSWSLRQENPDSNITHVKMNQIRDFMKERAELVMISKIGYFYGVKFK